MEKETEPIAVIGMSFKFPGGAETPESFWKMLVERRCAASKYPADRFNVDAFWHPDSKKLNIINSQDGHFLNSDIKNFDAGFFSVAPHEAGSMDPQQRGMMETTFHAFESAGLRMEDVAGTRTSVHIGCFTSDFATIQFRDAQSIPHYNSLGTAGSMLANRLSWFYDLRGESMYVDTACSSSLVAMSLACQGLMAGESDVAVVGGSNIILIPEFSISLSNMNMLSPTGRSHSFDSRADGYGRGEGYATLILKPLSKATADGNPIRALVRSIGTNQDGRTNSGITQPSKEMQVRLIRETYRKAGLDMKHTRFFESHGTGTPVGDPIEARAIGESFYKYRSEEDPIYVGAIKSNIGHLEGASGLAGVVKAILALERGIIPPNANFKQLNPQIDAEFFHLRFPTECIPWPVADGIRRASVNSFGFGGSNSHAVLEAADYYLMNVLTNGNSHHLTNGSHIINGGAELPVTSRAEYDNCLLDSRDHEPHLLVLSASDEDGIKRQAKGLSEVATPGHQRCSNDDVLADIVFTLNSRRSMMEWKSHAVLESLSDFESLQDSLSKPVRGSSTTKSNLGFIFTGQGAQWPRMGWELREWPLFRGSLARSQTCLDSMGCSWNLLDQLSAPDKASLMDDPEYSQAITTAVQLALVDLTAFMKMKPSVVVGHSSGEIAAAYCAGFLSHESAMRVSYFRGTLASKLAQNTTLSKWGMASVGLSPSEVSATLDIIQGQQRLGSFDMRKITMSCLNCPTNTTISGPDDYLDIVVSHLKSNGVFTRKLKVGVGYHSPQMSAIAGLYSESLAHLTTGTGTAAEVKMISSVKPGPVGVETVCSAQYWVQNMLSPVKFAEAMNLCCATSGEVPKALDRSHTRKILVHGWLELGPHAALKGPLREIFQHNERPDLTYASLLSRHKSGSRTFLDAIGKLRCHNFEVDLSRAAWISSGLEMERRTVVDLPRYSFNHSVTHWEESSRSKAFQSRSQPNHPLLGTQQIDWNPIDAKWCLTIKKDNIPWVDGHRLHGTMWYPAAGMVVMAVEAVKQLLPEVELDFELRDVSFVAPIVISEAHSGTEIQTAMAPAESTKSSRFVDYKFKIFVRREGDWDEACNGTISPQNANTESVGTHKHDEEEYKTELARTSYLEACDSCQGTLESADMYRKISDTSGLQYGDVFQPLKRIQYSKTGQAVATLARLDEVARETSKPFTIHPATLDGIFQLAIPALSRGLTDSLPTLVPSRVSRLWISRHGAGMDLEAAHDHAEVVHARGRFTSKRSAVASMNVFSESDMQMRIQVEDLETTEVARDQSAADSDEGVKAACHELDWKADPTLLEASDMFEYCARSRSASPEPEWWHENIRLMLLGFIRQALEAMAADNQMPIPSMEKYMSWLQARLDTYRNEGAETQQDIPAGAELQRLADHFRADGIRGDMGVLFGIQLREILVGEVDPLKLLFTDPQYTADFYDELNTMGKAFPMLSAYLDLLVHKDPGLRFLEVGAGSGASTSKVLATIGDPEQGPRYEEYCFTDVSGFFFPKAQERFPMYDKVQYRILDIEQEDLEGSGFAPGSYDVIVAANVLHATSSLVRTLSNVRKLLKCGGKLILMEMTSSDCLESGLVWSSLPGWWLSSEPFRQSSPIIGEDRWDILLKEAGFSGTEQIFRDWDSDICHSWSIMVSSATDRLEPNGVTLNGISAVHTLPKITLITDGKDCSLQVQIAEKLQTALSRQGNMSALEVVPLAQVPSISDDLRCRHCILLADLTESFLSDIEPGTFQVYQTIMTMSKSLLWVQMRDEHASSAPFWSMAEGLTRVCRSENPFSRIVTLTLESTSNLSTKAIATKIAKVFKAVDFDTQPVSRGGHDEDEYMEISGNLCVNRLRQAKYLDRHIHNRTHTSVSERPVSECPPITLDIDTPGLLDTLVWKEDESAYAPLPADEAEVEVRAIGVNFKDCLTLLGRVNTWDLGSECAGVVTRVGSEVSSLKVGDRVAVGMREAYRTKVRARERFMIPIPNFMSLEEAAGVPTAFCTAYYSLYGIARLQKGESILIHAAAGGTGQAAVQIAKHIDAVIYATVGSESKRKFLVERYGLRDDHIFHSRDDSFADGIRRMTNGRGVDVILNSLSGKLLVASWELIADFGRFVEIGRKDIDTRGNLPMYPFIRNATFTGLDLSAIFNDRGRINIDMMKDIFRLMESGVLKPSYPLQPFPIDQAEQAFRLLVSGKSSGKIVLTVDGNSTVRFRDLGLSGYQFANDATYVVAGGLGGIGRQIALWMARRGARYLLLLTRTNISGHPEKMAAISELESLGANVQYYVCDISEPISLREAVQTAAQSMPPIKGCFQAAMAIRDRPFATMSHQEWCTAVKPKVQGSWNLHATLPPGMDFFIMLSSAVCIFGNAAQANYAAGNTFLDALARHRIAQGEKAVAIDLGMVLDEGWLAERKNIHNRVMAFDHLLPISQKDLFAMFDYYCNPGITFSSPVAGQIVTGIETPALILQSGRTIPESMERPLFRAMHQVRPNGKAVTSTTAKKEQNFADMFGAAETLEAAGMIIAEALRAKLCRILGLDIGDKTIEDRMDSFGVDSLIALEVRNWLAKDIRADLAVYEILGDIKLVDIGMVASRKTEFQQPRWTTAEP
ncbi:polyketide synthase [Apiospora rasikravindrae]|uniref:Polyketide synthase n=1 Tax=Apiospora rasikravindrae TaxID=990691 RepID=A0ABR1S0N8_9PEZI